MVGVSLPVASAGVGLVGLMPFGVALGSPAGCEESSRLVVGRTTSGLEAISLPSSVVRVRDNNRSSVSCDCSTSTKRTK